MATAKTRTTTAKAAEAPMVRPHHEGQRPNWRSRKIMLPILGVAALLIAGYLMIGQGGLPL